MISIASGALYQLKPARGGAVCYTERWRTRGALDRHLSTPLYCRVLEAMECSCQPPQIEFLEVTNVSGFDVVERARSSHLKPVGTN